MTKYCCDNKKMIDLGEDFLNNNIHYKHLWICGDCGSIEEESSYSLDDEELADFISNFEDELRNTNIYKELKGGKS